MTHIRVTLPGAQSALEAEHQHLAEANDEGGSILKNCPALTNNERQYGVHLLVKEEKGGSGNLALRKDFIKKVAEILDVHPGTMTRIWKRFVKTRSTDSPDGDVTTRKRNSDQKKKPPSALEVIQNIPMKRRSNLKNTAQLSGIPISKLFWWLGEKAMKIVNVHAKSTFTQKNKFDQME